MTAEDVEYVRASYADLDSLCADAGFAADEALTLIDDGRLPGPSYVLPDGTPMVPRDYFALVDDAGGVERARELFARRYVAAGGELALIDEEWAGYLTGAYGVCLRRATPETIVRKGELVAEIEQLLAEPAPADLGWRDRLREAVDALDALERPFAPHYDRARWGPSSRDRYITAPRVRYPEALAVRSTSPA